MKYPLIIKTVVGVALLWIVALTAIHFLHLFQPTAASVGAWAQHQDWHALSVEERAQRVSALADKMNHLSYADRQKLQAEPGMHALEKQMTSDERISLLDQTLSQGLAQLLDTINRMKPEERRQLVSRALENMKKMHAQQQGPPPQLNNPAIQKVIQTGFSSYLQNASADTKLDVAPLIEQIQIDMQGYGN